MSARRAGKRQRTDGREAPFAYAGLERIFHERGRLAVCTCLVAHTDGNLSRHLAALAEMGIVAISKDAGQGRPTTTCRITKSGKTRFLSYIDELEAVVRDVHAGAETSDNDGRRRVPRLATT